MAGVSADAEAGLAWAPPGAQLEPPVSLRGRRSPLRRGAWGSAGRWPRPLPAGTGPGQWASILGTGCREPPVTGKQPQGPTLGLGPPFRGKETGGGAAREPGVSGSGNTAPDAAGEPEEGRSRRLPPRNQRGVRRQPRPSRPGRRCGSPEGGADLPAFATLTPKQGQWRPCLSGCTEHWLGSSPRSPTNPDPLHIHSGKGGDLGAK